MQSNNDMFVDIETISSNEMHEIAEGLNAIEPGVGTQGAAFDVSFWSAAAEYLPAFLGSFLLIGVIIGLIMLVYPSLLDVSWLRLFHAKAQK